jgi:hypothetical protein
MTAHAGCWLAGQQDLEPGGGDLLEQHLAHPAARHRGKPGRSTQYLGQVFAAAAPLIRECRRRQTLNVWRMGMRMAADLVATSAEFAHLVFGQKARSAEHRGHHEEVPPEASAL